MLSNELIADFKQYINDKLTPEKMIESGDFSSEQVINRFQTLSNMDLIGMAKKPTDIVKKNAISVLNKKLNIKAFPYNNNGEYSSYAVDSGKNTIALPLYASYYESFDKRSAFINDKNIEALANNIQNILNEKVIHSGKINTFAKFGKKKILINEHIVGINGNSKNLSPLDKIVTYLNFYIDKQFYTSMIKNMSEDMYLAVKLYAILKITNNLNLDEKAKEFLHQSLSVQLCGVLSRLGNVAGIEKYALSILKSNSLEETLMPISNLKGYNYKKNIENLYYYVNPKEVKISATIKEENKNDDIEENKLTEEKKENILENFGEIKNFVAEKNEKSSDNNKTDDSKENDITPAVLVDNGKSKSIVETKKEGKVIDVGFVVCKEDKENILKNSQSSINIDWSHEKQNGLENEKTTIEQELPNFVIVADGETVVNKKRKTSKKPKVNAIKKSFGVPAELKPVEPISVIKSKFFAEKLYTREALSNSFNKVISATFDKAAKNALPLVNNRNIEQRKKCANILIQARAYFNKFNSTKDINYSDITNIYTQATVNSYSENDINNAKQLFETVIKDRERILDNVFAYGKESYKAQNPKELFKRYFEYADAEDSYFISKNATLSEFIKNKYLKFVTAKAMESVKQEKLLNAPKTAKKKKLGNIEELGK